MKYLLFFPLLVQAAMGQSLFCRECKAFAQEVNQILGQLANQDESQIEQIIDQRLCDQLPVGSEVCKSLVRQYLPNIVNWLKNHDGIPDICAIIHICPASLDIEIDGSRCPECVNSESETQPGGFLCPECRAFVSQAEKELNNLFGDNLNPVQIEQILDSAVCDKMGPLRDYCMSLVKQDIPQIVHAIKNGEGALTICQIMHMCTSNLDKDVVPLDAVVVPQVKPGSPFCPLCQSLAKQAEAKLNNLLNADEGSVESLLDQEICNNLGPLKGYCIRAIKQYVPEIVKILESGEGDINICALIKLCPASFMEEIVVPEESVAVVEENQQPGKIECSLCKIVWGSLEPSIKKDLQKEEGPADRELAQLLCKKLPNWLQKDCDNEVDAITLHVVAWLDGKLDHLPLCQDIKLC